VFDVPPDLGNNVTPTKRTARQVTGDRVYQYSEGDSYSLRLSPPIPKLLLNKMTGLKGLLPLGKPSSKKQTSSTPERSADPSENVVQPVDVIDIDPEKLMERLKLKFGTKFEIHVGKPLECGEVESADCEL
jgi:hypothetical protein